MLFEVHRKSELYLTISSTLHMNLCLRELICLICLIFYGIDAEVIMIISELFSGTHCKKSRADVVPKNIMVFP